jgi:hypothetical protein
LEFVHLDKLTNLTSLTLYSTNITDTELSHISKLMNLRSLNLCSNEDRYKKLEYITDIGLEYIVKLENLRSLSLEFAKITEAGIILLTELVNLNWLNLRGTNITDAGFAFLAKLVNLKFVNLRKCHKITITDMDKFFKIRNNNYQKKFLDCINEYNLLGKANNSTFTSQDKDLHQIIAHYALPPDLICLFESPDGKYQSSKSNCGVIH